MIDNGLLKIELIDDSSNIDVSLEDNSENIDVNLTDYNDKGIKDDIEELRQTKVDKIEGKGLSTNDYTNEEKEKLSTLENYDDSEVRELIDTKQPRGNYITQETDPTVPNHVKNITQNDITSWNNKAEVSDIPDVSNFITKDVDDLTNYTKTSDLSNVALSGSYNDLSNKPSIPSKTSDITNDSGFITNTVNNLTNYTLKTNTGSLIDLEINQTTYVVTLRLKDQDGNTISTDTIDLPLENVVVSGSYDETNQKIVLTLQSGDTVDIPVGALVSGLQSEITSSNKLASDLVDDSNSGNKFTTTSEKQTWNNKLDSSALTNYVTNTDYATTSTAGLMSSTDKTKLDGIQTGATKNLIFYGTSATGASTSAKVVVCEDFTSADLVAGARITVYFTNANSYNGQATLNINSTGAKNIYYNGTTTSARYMWVAGESVDFIYNGEQWATINGGLATTTYYGVTKLATGANSDSQAYALTPRSLYYFANYSIAPYYSASKTYAVGDKVRYTYYIYECITAIETPEAWTAAHWKIVDPLQAQIDALEARIKALENS